MKTFNSSLHIRTKAVELLEKLHIDNHREINIPDLISKIDYDITYQFADLKGLAGFTCYDMPHDRYGIFLDSVTNGSFPSRTNFTLAHELGHIILGHLHGHKSNSIFIGDQFLEVEANIFADEILMPTIPIIRHKLDARDIAMTYNVSITAANNKTNHLRSNALYQQEQTSKKLYSILDRCAIRLNFTGYNNYMVRVLHDSWLDPDYEFGDLR